MVSAMNLMLNMQLGHITKMSTPQMSQQLTQVKLMNRCGLKRWKIGVLCNLALAITSQVRWSAGFSLDGKLFKLDSTFGWESGNRLTMHYEHNSNSYPRYGESIPLTDKLVPIVELSTIEREYLGRPYTTCIDVIDGYDITVCNSVRRVHSIVEE